MTPPTFWRRISQRQDVPGANPNDEAAQHNAERRHSLASSNATIRRSSDATINRYDAETEGQIAEQSGEDQPLLGGKNDKGPRGTLYLVVLTISLMGAQVAWSLELSYGTPYLLGLGLTPQATSLVWLAGPLSGLLVQPIVGSLSDASESRFRRRYYMIISSIFIFLSTITLAFAEPISDGIVDFLGLGLADWDPIRQDYADDLTMKIAVISFWVLDFALNGLQASGRALVLDSVEGDQVDQGNAWLGRMTHIGNVFGYTVGYLDLSRTMALRWLGGDQFRKFAFVAVLVMVATVSVTCFAIDEKSPDPTSTFSSSGGFPKEDQKPGFIARMKLMLADISQATRRLPRPIRRVCLVQFFAFLGWFPFLFYATTYIGTFEPRGSSRELRDHRERKSTMGMLIYSLVCLAFGIALPIFSKANAPDPRGTSLRSRFRSLILKALPGTASGISLRSFWGFGCALYGILMLLTFFVSDSVQAILVVASSGVAWAIHSWAPLALIMAFIKEAEQGSSPYEFQDDWYSAHRTEERRRRRASRQSLSMSNEVSQGEGVANGDGDPQDGSVARRQLRESLGDCQPLRNPSGSSVRSGSASTVRSRQRMGSGNHIRVGSGSYVARGGEVVRDQSTPSSSSPRRANFLRNASGGEDGTASPASINYSGGRDGGDGGHGSPIEEADEDDGGEGGKGGTILGIYNAAIVCPQFIIALISSLIFSHFNQSTGVSSSLDPSSSLSALRQSGNPNEGDAPGVVWVLRFGALAALVAAFLTRLVPLTEAERKVEVETAEAAEAAAAAEDDGGTETGDGQILPTHR